MSIRSPRGGAAGLGHLWLAAAAALGLLLAASLWTLASGDLPIDRLVVSATPIAAPLSADPMPAGAFGPIRAVLVDVPVPAAIGMLSWLGIAAIYLAGIAIALMMHRLFADLRSSGVFAKSNVGRLARSGWILIGAELFRIATSLGQEYFVRSRIAPAGWHVAPVLDRDVHLFFGGLLLLGLAHAFRLASRLRKQVELTI